MLEILNTQTPADMCENVARRSKARRKELGLSQAELAKKSGVSLGSLRRFEQTGEVSLHSLARISKALGYEKDFDQLFSERAYKNIQEVIDAQRN